jgi:hypothetical protein
MAGDSVTSIERVEDKVRQGSADWADMYKANLTAGIASGQAVINGWQSLNAELLAFMQSRVKGGLETSRQVAGCTSPEGALEIQMEYGRAALQAYVDESRRMGELFGKVVTDTIEPLRTQATAAAAKAKDSVAA